MLHHGGMWKEEVSERVFVASTMQRTRVSRLERCCITVECGRKRLASECLLHQRCIALGFRGWRDVASVPVACGKEEVSGEGLLHRWCKREMLHHTGMWKEEVSGEGLLHRWCKWEMLHHSGMWKEELASECLLRHWCNTLGFREMLLERCCITGACIKGRLASVCCIRVNDATDHATGSGKEPSFEAGEMSRLHHCCSKLHARGGKRRGVQLNEMLQDDFSLNSRKSCISPTASPGYDCLLSSNFFISKSAI
jgi:hypothetical protein